MFMFRILNRRNKRHGKCSRIFVFRWGECERRKDQNTKNSQYSCIVRIQNERYSIGKHKHRKYSHLGRVSRVWMGKWVRNTAIGNPELFTSVSCFQVKSFTTRPWCLDGNRDPSSTAWFLGKGIVFSTLWYNLVTNGLKRMEATNKKLLIVFPQGNNRRL